MVVISVSFTGYSATPALSGLLIHTVQSGHWSFSSSA